MSSDSKKWQVAETAFSLGNYVEFETLAYEAKDLAIQITKKVTQSKIDDAEDALATAQKDK